MNPTHEQIAEAAYYIWLHQEEQALFHPGWEPVLSPEHNWYLAEQQLRQRYHLETTQEDKI